MNRDGQDLHDRGGDAAAYALGALTGTEADDYRRHLEGCARCQMELAAFVRVVDVLPMTAPQFAPDGALRRRVLADVRAEPREASPGPRRRRMATSPLSGIGVPRPGLVLAVVTVLALMTVGALVALPGGSTSERLLQARVFGSAGSASLRVSGGHAELSVRRLPPPPSGRIYEVWLERRGSQPAPTRALFSVTSSGAADVGIPGNLDGVSTIVVTPEPEGGSREPTRPPVIVAPTS